MFIRRHLFSGVKQRFLILAAIPLFSILSLFTPVFTQNASAVSYDDVLLRARAWSILNAVVDKRDQLDSTISTSDADSCHILGSLDNVHAKVGHHSTEDNDHNANAALDGATWDALEENSNPAKAALAAVGIQGGCRGLLEVLGYTFNGGSLRKPGNFTPTEKLRAVLPDNAFYGAHLGDAGPGDALSYVILHYHLTRVCGWNYSNPYFENNDNTEQASRNREAKSNGATGENNKAYYHTYTYEAGKAGDNTYYRDGGTSSDLFVGSHSGFTGAQNDAELDCGDNNADTFGAKLADNHRYADAFADLVRPGGEGTPGTCGEKYPPGADPARNEILRSACDEGFQHKGVAGYCDKFGDPGQKNACLYGQNSATGGANDTTPLPADGDVKTKDKTTCAIPGIGWLVCPVVDLMAKVVDGAYSFVAALLTVQPVTTDPNSLLFRAWSAMRNFANVAFVIAFLVIIFSQVTSLGISNYGIKRMLPRLVVAAILVNVSFWVCAIAVDLSNIAGTSIKALFDGIAQGFSLPDANSGLATSNRWQGLVGGLLSGTVLIGAALFIGLSALLPVLVACLFAILVVFIALIIRQALIVLLIVISPLAFVAYLLPNTENLFTRWRRMFTLFLLMFPIIALIFGASALASKIVMGS